MLFTVKIFQVIEDVVMPKVIYTFEADSEQELSAYMAKVFPNQKWQHEIIEQ